MYMCIYYKYKILAAKGRPRGGLCPPPWSILMAPKMGRFLEPPKVAEKSMDVRLGAAWEPKWRHDGSSGARRELGKSSAGARRRGPF